MTCASPTLDSLLEDYLEHNPTRNRALDMLPIFAQVDERRVQQVVQDNRVNPRPAFHYRLPNCHIERPEWSLLDDWRAWLNVERLANRPADITRLSETFLAAERPLIGINHKQWAETIDQWINDPESV